MKRACLFLFLGLLASACGGEDPGNAGPRLDTPKNDGGATSTACVHESNQEMCARLGYACGELTAEDNCGKERTVALCGDEATACAAPATCGGGGTPGQCGCTADDDATLCEAASYACGTLQVTDTCGVERAIDCGDEATVCGGHDTCGGGGVEGLCGCTPADDAALCADAGYECGELTTTDNCGEERTAACGGGETGCAAPLTCGGGGTEGTCGCTPLSDETLCEEALYECGTLETTDNCEQPRVVSCGDESTVCTGLDTCGGGGAAGLCGCTPDTDATLCAAAGYVCGTLTATDGCGAERTVNCGDEATVCGAFGTCGGGGTPGQCGCSLQTDAAFCASSSYECGDLTKKDSCGANRTVNCGACQGSDVCGGSTPGKCGCAPLSDANLCAKAGFTCGPLSATDNCGNTRNVTCGDCSGADTCGGGGVEGTCGCTPIDDVTFCASASYECGILAKTDNCGAPRNVNCGDEAAICSAYNTCGGGGTAGQCGCTPKTCASEQMLCGELQDGCGNTLQCDSFCVQSLGAGAAHACAIGSGLLRCWGKNDNGQLGNGNNTTQQNPVALTGLPTIVSVAPGGRHTCALTDAGKVYCWGHNNRSQLGLGTLVNSNKPGDPAVLSGATQIVSGEEHSCALVNGAVRCWGSNDYGQIGDASLDLGVNVGVATTVNGLSSGVKAIAAGKFHNCAFKNDASVWCWGRNRFSQLGNLQAIPQQPGFPVAAWGFTNNLSLDANTLRRSPIQVSGFGAAPIVGLAVGADYSCALDDERKVWCWGAMTRAPSGNSCPVLTGKFDYYGNALTTDAQACTIFPPPEGGVPIVKYAPEEVLPPKDPKEFIYYLGTVFASGAALAPQLVPISNVLKLNGGADHVCMVIDEPDPAKTNVWCLGHNGVGQLGDGTNNNRPAPTELYWDVDNLIVRGTTTAAGADFSCAIVGDASLKCWGSNQYGQIGNSALLTQSTYRPFGVKLVYGP
jgi:alpha-tubulin suppressor-like RCC1 family protein